MRPSKHFYAARNNLPKMPKFCEFRAIGPQFSLFSTLFTVDAKSVPVELQMKVVDLQCDSIVKQKYTEIGIPDFYKFVSFSQTRGCSCKNHVHVWQYIRLLAVLLVNEAEQINFTFKTYR